MNKMFKKLSRRTAVVLVGAASFVGLCGFKGCSQSQQQTTAALIKIVGQSVTTLANLQGNSAVAAQLTDASNAAASAVTNWQPGSPADQVTQALNLLVKNINLIPVSDATKVYIELAVTTVNSILAIVAPPSTPTGMMAPRATKPIVTPSEYRKQWNALTVAHPASHVPQLQ